MKSFLGGCLCGQVRYEILAAAGPSRVCWCRDCQRISSNGTVNVIFPSAGSGDVQLLVTGSTGETLSTVNVSTTGIGAGL